MNASKFTYVTIIILVVFLTLCVVKLCILLLHQ